VRAIFLGIVSSLFFASTFVLNRAMELQGGSWIWSSVLRYLFMIPPLFILVLMRGNLKELFLEMAKKPLLWLLWSTVGFGIFYAPICFAAAYGPSWLVASTWQITIVAGSMLAPFFIEKIEIGGLRYQRKGKIPVKGLLISVFILLGVVLVQFQQAHGLSTRGVIIGVLPVIIAAFAYPLGNRKMMELCGGSLDTFQRVLGMTMASLPFWLVLSLYGSITIGAPSKAQTLQSVVVALCSGVIATLLFFKATDLTKGDISQLAAVEATQSGEVLFALLGELVFLHGSLPSSGSLVGMGIVIIGMIMHSFSSHNSSQVRFDNITAIEPEPSEPPRSVSRM
jgi:drug/metabolite transporter (DMT)-like permease